MKRVSMCLLVLVAACAISGSAAAGGPGTPKVKGAKAMDGPWKQELFSKARNTKTLFVRVRSTHDAKQRATITEQTAGEGSEDFRFRWFRGDTDISHDVQTAGYEFGLPEGAARKLEVKVKPLVDKPRAVCLYANVTVDVPTTGTNGPFFALRKRDACEP